MYATADAAVSYYSIKEDYRAKIASLHKSPLENIAAVSHQVFKDVIRSDVKSGQAYRCWRCIVLFRSL
jgi:hypothetical protein